MKYILASIFSIFVYQLSFAALTIPHFFADNMVLQQSSQVKIWGKTTSKKKIQVKTSWDGKSYKTAKDQDGNWSLWIETPKAGGPYNIQIQQEEKITLHDVLIGEVWICSGQSNMDMPIKGYYGQPIRHAAELLLASPNDQIRLFRIERSHADNAAFDVNGNWSVSNAASVANFSAVGYQFAKYLQQHLHVPIGIIQTTWGGSPIEAWMKPSLVERSLRQQKLPNRAIGKQVHQQPGNLYHAMICPLIGFRIAGVIWYQGEQNRYNYYDYNILQTNMIRDWRNTWDIGEWPFYYVEIAPMQYGGGQGILLPRLREMQLKTQDSLSNAGMAATIDGGEMHNIHPANKTIVAQRLASWALGSHYQKKGIAYQTPTLDKIVVLHDTVLVSLKHCPLGITSYGKSLTQFELAGTDQIFHPAIAVLQNNRIVVTSAAVKAPLAVRYAFHDWCFGELYSTEGIPVASFRSDNWP